LTRTAEQAAAFRKIYHIVQATDFIDVSWEYPFPTSFRSLSLRYPEAWWKFESPIRGKLPERPSEILASGEWLRQTGRKIGDTVRFGTTRLKIVGSVGVTSRMEFTGRGGAVSIRPRAFFFVPCKTILVVTSCLADKIGDSLTYAWHVRLKIYPPKSCARVVKGLKHSCGMFHYVNLSQPDYSRLRQPALASISLLESVAFALYVVGIVILFRHTRRPCICSFLCVWIAVILVVLLLAAYTIVVPSRFVELCWYDVVSLMKIGIIMNVAVFTSNYVVSKFLERN